LVVLKRRHPRPALHLFDKVFWVTVSRLWSQWKQSLIVDNTGLGSSVRQRSGSTESLAPESFSSGPYPHRNRSAKDRHVFRWKMLVDFELQALISSRKYVIYEDEWQLVAEPFRKGTMPRS
jgi:hypothetical protein